MLAGHCDQIGLIVSYLDSDGFLYLQSIGGWDPQVLIGQRLTIWTDGGPVFGVIGRKPIHLLTEEERKQVPKLRDLWLDIGAANREEAEKLVQIGDPVTLELEYRELRNGRAASPAMDDKCGTWVVIEALRRINAAKLRWAVYAVSTVQEEVGLRGAKTSAFEIDPEVGVAVDVTHATDCPTIEKKEEGDVALGHGPVIHRGPNMNPKVVRRLVEVAGTAVERSNGRHRQSNRDGCQRHPGKPPRRGNGVGQHPESIHAQPRGNDLPGRYRPRGRSIGPFLREPRGRGLQAVTSRGRFKIVGWDKPRSTKGSELPQRQRSPTSFAMGFETATQRLYGQVPATRQPNGAEMVNLVQGDDLQGDVVVPPQRRNRAIFKRQGRLVQGNPGKELHGREENPPVSDDCHLVMPRSADRLENLPTALGNLAARLTSGNGELGIARRPPRERLGVQFRELTPPVALEDADVDFHELRLRLNRHADDTAQNTGRRPRPELGAGMDDLDGLVLQGDPGRLALPLSQLRERHFETALDSSFRVVRALAVPDAIEEHDERLRVKQHVGLKHPTLNR